jgi:hypothetical protein
MACDKNQTYLQVRWIWDWTHLPASMFVIKRTASADLLTMHTASDLSTIQFRLIFKGHKSLEYCCLVIHLTSVSTISYAESNGGIFILIAPLGITLQFSRFYRPQLTIRDCCCINFMLIWHQYVSHKVVIY